MKLHAEGFDTEAEKTLRRDLSAASYLLPDWLKEMVVEKAYIEAEDGEGRTIATVSIGYPYGWAKMSVSPDYFTLNEPERRHILIHEILHIHHLPYAEFTGQCIADVMAGKEIGRDLYARIAVEKMEQFIEGLARRLSEGALVDARINPEWGPLFFKRSRG